MEVAFFFYWNAHSKIIIPYFCCLIRQHGIPTIKTIDTIKIDIYSREHPPPHFHAKFAEYEELIEIGTLATYVGNIPKAQRKKVTAWAVNNNEFLLSVFKKLNPGL